ncbi:hypothetical protein DB29_03464 [Shouchella clausii]|nr:hypothetical protein DB29_03464 [Shouchella clausii]
MIIGAYNEIQNGLGAFPSTDSAHYEAIKKHLYCQLHSEQ